MPADPQHLSWRSSCICRRKLLLPRYSLAELCLFIVVDLEKCSDPGKTGEFWEPGLQTATPGQCSPMKPELEAYKSSQNAVIASTAQVDQVASECARELKTNSLWKYLSFSNFQFSYVVLLCIQQNAGAVTGPASMASVLCGFPVCHPSTSLAAKTNPDSRAGVPGGCSCCFRSCDPRFHWPHPFLTSKLSLCQLLLSSWNVLLSVVLGIGSEALTKTEQCWGHSVRSCLGWAMAAVSSATCFTGFVGNVSPHTNVIKDAKGNICKSWSVLLPPSDCLFCL